ncbi:MAG: hypothetical protein ACFFEY_10560 [Candidatus Thorarchaeota archaeon]
MAVEKKFEKMTNLDFPAGESINVASSIIIPFSEFGENKKCLDIYDGSEKISFNKRDPEYKTIFKNEFAGNDLFEFHKHLIKINYLLTKLSD